MGNHRLIYPNDHGRIWWENHRENNIIECPGRIWWRATEKFIYTLIYFNDPRDLRWGRIHVNTDYWWMLVYPVAAIAEVVNCYHAHRCLIFPRNVKNTFTFPAIWQYWDGTGNSNYSSSYCLSCTNSTMVADGRTHTQTKPKLFGFFKYLNY